MKKLLFTFLASLMLMGSARASHILGGEISWDCLTNGQYVFYMSVYRDCDGIPFTFNAQTLEIFNGPLPRNQNNGTISQIILNPDSNRWLNARNGDTSPTCDPNALNSPKSCSNGDVGSVQEFFFKSAPTTLRGTPPASGWRFVWTAPCCRPNDVANLAQGGTMILRAEMFADANGSNVNPCKDSSPKFRALPTNSICRGYTFTYNHTAIDRDLDSLVYSWDRTYNTPGANPNPVPYASRYNFNNPTPDQSFNANNIACTLDPITGIMRVAVYNGVGTGPQSYLTVVQVDAYRDGVIISSNYREIPFYFFDCPPLATGQINKAPEIFIDGVPAEGLITDIVAGQTVRIPFQAKDQDFTGIGLGLQRITVTPDGFMFARDKIDKNNCEIAGIAPCATLQNRAPILNTAAQPPKYEIAGFAGVATELVWDTRCYHIATAGTGVPGQAQGIYNFVMRVQDDHCPIPGINYPTITVRVRDPIPLTEPVMKGASVGLDGRLTYSWVPPMDSTFTFNRYRSEFSAPSDNAAPAFFQPLDVVTNYQQQRRNGAFQFYANGANNQPNILQKRPNTDWYFRMLSESGCKGDVQSQFSEPVQVIEVKATPAGPGGGVPRRSIARLDWNRPKPLNAFSYPYFQYESNTHYYIWQNDSIEQNGQYIGGEAVAGNWFLRGDTNALTYEIPTTTCNGRVGFRIEARDTVITWKEGTAPRQDSLDTLVFSTFSTIDTMLMVSRGFIPQPRFDTVEVRQNGDVYFRIDRAAAGTAGEFRIYDNAGGNRTLIASFSADVDSFLYTGAGANATVGRFILESIDECDPDPLTNSNESPEYTTFIPDGFFDACLATFRIGLDDPTGFKNGISGYRVYVDTVSNDGSGPYVLRKTVNNPSQDSVDILVAKNTDHWIKVVAFDNFNDVIIGRVLFPAQDFRTNEVVPGPEVYCTFVEDNGEVTLSFGEPRDSTNNTERYEFEYRRDGGNWVTYTGSNLISKGDTAHTITGINAFTGAYEFRTRTISGCDGITPSPYSPIISVMNLNATAINSDPSKPVNLDWNKTGAANVGQYNYYKTLDNIPPYTAPQLGLINLDSTTYRDQDPRNSINCSDTLSYFLTVEHLTGCVSRSTPAVAVIETEGDPPVQVVDFVTVNPSNGLVEVYWSEGPNGVDSIFAIEEQGPNNFTKLASAPWNARSITIPQSVLDATDTTVTVTLQSFDECLGVARNYPDFDYHTSMDVEVEWEECDSINKLSWNPYTDFNEGGDGVTYEVYVSTNLRGPFDLVANSVTSDTTYEHKITQGGRRYYYYIKATNGTNTFSSTSNVDSDSAYYQEKPLYGYFYNATVLESKEVELNFFKDTTIEQGAFAIYRGSSRESLSPLARVSGSEVFKDEMLTYVDASALTDDYSYFYNIVTENLCGNKIDTSNFARSIHLTVDADNEALTNTLRWNAYEAWDSTVAYYNIYRGFNGAQATELYATVPPADDKNPMIFVDDVYDDALVIGQYCYKVEAVQGTMTNDFPNSLDAATSASNEVCVTQEPLFYVPNAFAPDGTNRMFTPKGQFFDFTLYEMVIYNRWGEEIFRTRDINKGWTGEVNGKEAPLGSYVYTIRFVDADGDEHRRKGTVTLVR